MTPWLRAALLTPHISRTTSASVLRRGMASSADHVTNFQSTLSNPELFQTQAFIDGEFVPGSGGTYEVSDPGTGHVITNVASCTDEDTNRAIDLAHEAFGEWSQTTAKHRSLILRKWFDLLQQHSEDLARILSLEAGKSLAEARGEVAYAASFFEWFGEEAKRTYGEIIPATLPGRQLVVLKQPVGVCSMITPWNFPAAMITRKVGACVAAGATAVVKPAEDTPLTALAIAQLGIEAGLPKGVYSVLPCPRELAASVGERLCKHPKVRKMSFTGSTPVGVQLAQWCAEGVKKVSLELGGNAPFIVFDDADVDVAVQAFMAAKFRNTGQTCVCANRILVQEGIHDSFIAKLRLAMSSIKVGHGLEPDTTQGPLINKKAVQKVGALVSKAVEQGAELLEGSTEGTGGNFYPPTLLTGVTDEMDIFAEEIFGPVCAVGKFTNEDEAIALANDSSVGLAGYFCSRDLGRVWRVAEALEVGMVGVNEGIISTEVAPFGGVKMSGLGREGSSHGMDEYMEMKYVCMGGLSSK